MSLKGLVRIDDFIRETEPVIHLREIYDVHDLELSSLIADIFKKRNNGYFSAKNILKIKLLLHCLGDVLLINESLGMKLIREIDCCLEEYYGKISKSEIDSMLSKLKDLERLKLLDFKINGYINTFNDKQEIEWHVFVTFILENGKVRPYCVV